MQINYQVIGIGRYLGDPQHATQTGGVLGQNLDICQVTICDDTHKLTVLLTTELGRMVQENKISVGSVVKLTKCHLHFDETDLTGNSVIIVQEMAVTGHREITRTMLDAVIWCPDCSDRERQDLPLTSSRGYFVNVWSTTEMYGDIWKTSAVIHNNLGDLSLTDMYSLREVCRRWSSVKPANPAVLVKVLLKSRIIHYAKPNKNDKWPFQAHMLVGDKSGACTAVFWNAMCPEFYHSIHEGSILLLRKFNVKKSFQTVPRYRPALDNLELYDIDINLNSHHPVSEVKVIDPTSVPPEVELPNIKYNFVTRRQYGCLPDNVICDIVGVVTYVGKWEREPIHNKFGIDSGGFWVRRWLHLQDQTSTKPFCVQVYRVAQGLPEIDICPGNVVVCRHVRVIHGLENIHMSRDVRHLYLTTTAESQIMVIDDRTEEYLQSQPMVQQVTQWSKSSKCGTVVRKAVIGGYFTYPPLPSTIEDIRDRFKDTQVTSSQEWEKVFRSLCYRECRQLLLQAIMVHVRVKHTRDSRSDCKLQKRKADEQASSSTGAISNTQDVVLDTELYQQQTRLPVLGCGLTEPLTTVPVHYTNDQWSAIRQRLHFPISRVENKSSDTLDIVELSGTEQAYLIISWVGLNNRVILQTLLHCPNNISRDSRLVDVLTGVAPAHPPQPADTGQVPDIVVRQLLRSAPECANTRFLLVVDCYQGDSEDPEIMLNRAIPLRLSS